MASLACSSCEDAALLRPSPSFGSPTRIMQADLNDKEHYDINSTLLVATCIFGFCVDELLAFDGLQASSIPKRDATNEVGGYVLRYHREGFPSTPTVVGTHIFGAIEGEIRDPESTTPLQEHQHATTSDPSDDLPKAPAGRR